MTNDAVYYCGGEPVENVFERIRTSGGWPDGKKYLAAFHGCELKRECMFCKMPVRNEWWTTIATRDDYFWWRISPEFKLSLARSTIEEFKHRIARL